MSPTDQPAEAAITETVPPDVVRSSLTRFRLIVAGNVLFFGVLLLYCAVDHAGEIGWSQALAVALLIWFPCLLFGLGLNATMRHELTTRIPTVRLSGEELSVRYGKRRLAAHIKDCRFHRGSPYRMRLPGCPRLQVSGKTILIDFQPRGLTTAKRLLWGPRVRVAVGYTEESRVKWERALSSVFCPTPR